MNCCVIFNPVAKGDKARHFREQLAAVSAACALKPTTCAGDGQRLATEAVREGFDVIVAAGGDGTVNEVLNGLAKAPDGLARARLAVLPLGTINVFARELALPFEVAENWRIIRAGRERAIDLPFADFMREGWPARRYFAQLAGAGLDSRAIELVSWKWKKRVGPLAYLMAGVQALQGSLPLITASDGATSVSGELVLLGNGAYYGASYTVFPQADLADGLLDAVVFPRVDWSLVLRVGLSVALTRQLPRGNYVRLRGPVLEVTSPDRALFELDGDNAGPLPVTFRVQPRALRVTVP